MTAQPHDQVAGARTLGVSAASTTALIRNFERGLPVTVVDHLSAALGLTPAHTLPHIGLSARTFARRKLEGRLTPEESERAARLARVVERTHEAYGPEAGNRWLHTALPALLGDTPLRYAQTDIGAEFVIDLISASEEGLFV